MIFNINSKNRLWLIYLSGFLMSVHFASISYLNSSLLKQFVSDQVLSILYIIGSLLSLLSLFLAPRLARHYGNNFVFGLFSLLEMLAVIGMGFFNVANLIIGLFVIHLAADSILYFCLDLNLERETKVEGTTGNKRGVLLTFSNIAWVISPLALTFLVTQSHFEKIYWLSGLALLPLLLIIFLFFKNSGPIPLHNTKIYTTLKYIWTKKDQVRVIGIQFILNFFYAWMIIYLPLVLNQEVGFNWNQIGFLFVIMLLPFLLFEWPAGVLADKKIGEREILAVGILLIFLATIAIPVIKVAVFWFWALSLFITRVGASLVEIGAESYFFKQVKDEDLGLISLFRATRPLSFVIVPLIALPMTHWLSYGNSFYFLALVTILGLSLIPKIDTR